MSDDRPHNPDLGIALSGEEKIAQAVNNAPLFDGDRPSVSPVSSPKDIQATLDRLAGMSRIEYELCRKDEAKRLGFRPTILDHEIADRRGDSNDDRGFTLNDPEPWPEPVDGAALLDRITTACRVYLVLPQGGLEVFALWALHAHCFEAFPISPRLNIQSPEKNCGKTVALDVLESLVPRGVRAESITLAVFFRLADACKPSILIDEADTFLKDNDELRGAINAGHRKGGKHLRCEGDSNQIKGFRTFVPTVVAGIGRLPGTIADRSIEIQMKRRRPDQTVESFRSDRASELEMLQQQAARWADDNLSCLRNADPNMPEWAFNRVADNWRPLFAIADVAGGRWPALARQIAKSLVQSAADADSAGVQLLQDIRDLFHKTKETQLASAYIAEEFAGMEDRPWPEWGRSGNPITTRQIASQLRPFGIKPKTIRTGVENTIKGYRLEDCKDAFARYNPDPIRHTVTLAKNGDFFDDRSVTRNDIVTDRNPEKTAETLDCYGVTDRNAGNGQSALFSDDPPPTDDQGDGPGEDDIEAHWETEI